MTSNSHNFEVDSTGKIKWFRSAESLKRTLEKIGEISRSKSLSSRYELFLRLDTNEGSASITLFNNKTVRVQSRTRTQFIQRLLPVEGLYSFCNYELRIYPQCSVVRQSSLNGKELHEKS